MCGLYRKDLFFEEVERLKFNTSFFYLLILKYVIEPKLKIIEKKLDGIWVTLNFIPYK